MPMQDRAHIDDIKRVLLATDLSAAAHGAHHAARAVCKATGAELHVVTVLRPPEYGGLGVDKRVVEAWRAEASAEIDGLVREHGLDAGAGVHVEEGDPAKQTLAVMRAIDADMLVISRSGAGGENRSALGRTADRLVRGCPAHVLIARPEHVGGFDHIAAATDFSECSERATLRAVDLARRFGHSQTQLLHAYEVTTGYHRMYSFEEFRALLGKAARKEARRYLERLEARRDGGVDVRIRTAHGEAGKAIARMVRRNSVDLLVVATHGRTASAEFLLGSVATQLLRLAPCSVWIEKTPSMRQGFLRAIGELFS